MEKKLTWAIVIVVVLVVVGGFYWLWTGEQAKAAKLETFAICIKNSGAEMYGAFWCPHCQNQKAMFNTLFGGAADKLPYIECSTPDANGQLDVCKAKGIKTYPTWKFADGSTNEGEMPLQMLADKTACPLP